MAKKEFGVVGSVSLFLSFFFINLSAGIAFELVFNQVTATQVISNPKSPRSPDGKMKRILFKEELSIGVVEGNENYMFGNIIIVNSETFPSPCSTAGTASLTSSIDMASISVTSRPSSCRVPLL
jgi:hypothetical protein